MNANDYAKLLRGVEGDCLDLYATRIYDSVGQYSHFEGDVVELLKGCLLAWEKFRAPIAFGLWTYGRHST